MPTCRPRRHADGRKYATFFDLPRECRDLCYIEYLQNECGDALSKHGTPHPIVVGAGPMRVLSRQVRDEFDDLICLWARCIRVTVRYFDFSTLITYLNKLDDSIIKAMDRTKKPRPSSTGTPPSTLLRIQLRLPPPGFLHWAFYKSLTRWLNRFAVAEKRGHTLRIEYEIANLIDGSGLLSYYCSVSMESMATQFGLFSPIATWYAARMGQSGPVFATGSPLSRPAQELCGIFDAVTQYHVKVREATERANLHAGKVYHLPVEQEFDVGMKALQRSRQAGTTWDVEYAKLRPEILQTTEAPRRKRRKLQ